MVPTTYFNIETLLKKKGKTRHWLVKNLNSSYPEVNKMVNNQKKAISMDKMAQLCLLFECSYDELFTLGYRDETAEMPAEKPNKKKVRKK